MVNMTCPTIPDKPSDPKPFFENGNIDFKAHDVGWLICGIMALIATISSVWLIWKHLTYYTCPQQQRHIVRLLIMVPIYAIVSFMSYLFYHEALYYQTIRDCYEAVLVTSFFYLILAYTGDTRAEQHAVFRNIEVKDRFWVWPLGSWKYKPEGLHFLWLMKICVLQYAIFRPLCTFIAVGTEYFGYYCLHSWMPWFTHVWCALIISISVTVAMYCLIQLYMPVRKLVDPYKPILKFLAIKTIVFITFWQDTLLSFLVSFNVIKETEYFTAEQIQAGINALLQCFWMLLFGFIHIKAFSYLPYRPEDRSRTTLRGKALLDSLDFRDWFFEMKESTRYMAARRKGRNYTLAEDLRAKRHQHLLNALGKQRNANLDAEMDMEKAAMPTFWKNPEDAQFWTPSGDESDSGYGSSKNANSDAKSSSRPSNSANDAYTLLPNPVGGRAARQVSKSLAADKSATTASHDSHAQRAAELQRLVAELDLQDVDQSIVGAEDHDYGYEDEKYERAALMDRQPGTSKKHVETPEVKELHPELTQYHTPTIQLANVPSLSYDHDSASGSGSGRRGKDLSAVAEEEDEEADKAALGRVAPGVGAFGIAAWLGWNNTTTQSQNQPAYHAAGESDHFLHPGGSYGARVAAHTPDAEGTGWWRNYWDRVSNPGSREPSIAGIDDEEKQPLAAERPAVMRQVTAASWGIEHTQSHQQRALPQPPTLKIDTHPDRDEASDDSAASPSSSSLISPHVNSPLSRLIQTSRDSFSSLNRDEIREQLLAANSPARLPPLPASDTSRNIAPPAVKVVPVATRPNLAPRNPSLAPSSNQASVSRVLTTTTDRRSAPTTSAYESAASIANTAARQMANEMLSCAETASTKHPIKFVDALLPPAEGPSEGEGEMVSPKGSNKVLPPAVGPKGKLVNLVLPNPLSPARFPYGQEGTPLSNAPSGPGVAEKEAVSRREPGTTQPAQAMNGGGSLKWAHQPPKPLEPKEREQAAAVVAGGTVKPKLPEGKGLITVGALSLSQQRALLAEARSSHQRQSSSATKITPSQSTPSTTAGAGGGGGVPKSILATTSTSNKQPVGEGKLVLPAPSKLASAEAEDPYRAGNASLATTAQKGRRERVGRGEKGREGGSVTTSGGTKTSIAGTAFEVGSLVPRAAVVRASMPAGAAPLAGYYDPIRSQNQHSQVRDSVISSGGGGGSFIHASGERHSYVPSGILGVRPAMLPPHPGHQHQPHQPQQQHYYSRPAPPPSSHWPQQGQPQQYAPRAQYPQQPPYPHQTPQQQQQQARHPGPPGYYPTPTHQPQQSDQAKEGRSSQFQFEYYRE